MPDAIAPERPLAPVPPGGCHASIGEAPCRQPAVSQWAAACIHEHVVKFDLCATCVEQLLRRGWRCTACRDGAQPHDCAATITQLDPSPAGGP